MTTPCGNASSPCDATGSDWQGHAGFSTSVQEKKPSFASTSPTLLVQGLPQSCSERRVYFCISPILNRCCLAALSGITRCWAGHRYLVELSPVTELKVMVKLTGMSLFCALPKEYERGLGFRFLIFSTVVSLPKGFKCCCFCDSKN